MQPLEPCLGIWYPYKFYEVQKSLNVTWSIAQMNDGESFRRLIIGPIDQLLHIDYFRCRITLFSKTEAHPTGSFEISKLLCGKVFTQFEPVSIIDGNIPTYGNILK